VGDVDSLFEVGYICISMYTYIHIYMPMWAMWIHFLR
jgi:hypothetical protein